MEGKKTYRIVAFSQSQEKNSLSGVIDLSEKRN